MHSTVSGFYSRQDKTWNSWMYTLKSVCTQLFQVFFWQDKTWNSWVYTSKVVCTQLFQVLFGKIKPETVECIHFWVYALNCFRFLFWQNKTWNLNVYTQNVYTQMFQVLFWQDKTWNSWVHTLLTCRLNCFFYFGKIKPETVESTLLSVYTQKCRLTKIKPVSGFTLLVRKQIWVLAKINPETVESRRLTVCTQVSILGKIKPETVESIHQKCIHSTVSGFILAR